MLTIVSVTVGTNWLKDLKDLFYLKIWLTEKSVKVRQFG